MMFTIPEVFVDYPNPVSVTYLPHVLSDYILDHDLHHNGLLYNCIIVFDNCVCYNNMKCNCIPSTDGKPSYVSN